MGLNSLKRQKKFPYRSNSEMALMNYIFKMTWYLIFKLNAKFTWFRVLEFHIVFIIPCKYTFQLFNFLHIVRQSIHDLDRVGISTSFAIDHRLPIGVDLLLAFNSCVKGGKEIILTKCYRSNVYLSLVYEVWSSFNTNAS